MGDGKYRVYSGDSGVGGGWDVPQMPIMRWDGRGMGVERVQRVRGGYLAGDTWRWVVK